MKPEALDELKFALSAYNDANRQSNRMWSAAAILAVLVFTSRFGDGEQVMPILNIKTSQNLPFVLIILCGINISYTVVHANVYRLAAVYRSIAEKEDFRQSRISERFSWSDLAYRAPISNFNRIYPLFMPLEAINKVAYRLFKIAFDIVFCGLPVIAIIFGLSAVPVDNVLFSFLVVISALSIASTVLLMRLVIRWPWINPN